MQVSGILAAKSRVMSSKQAPLWMVFRNGDGPHAPNWTMLCKQGDDIRQDHLTLQVRNSVSFTRTVAANPMLADCNFVLHRFPGSQTNAVAVVATWGKSEVINLRCRIDRLHVRIHPDCAIINNHRCNSRNCWWHIH